MPIKASIYCSSSDTIDEKYFEEAVKCGQILARHGVECYTGGGNNGLMYALEKSVIGNGGSCIGIIPQFMIDYGLALRRSVEDNSGGDNGRTQSYTPP